MAMNGVIEGRQGSAFDLLTATVAVDGSAPHPHVHALMSPRAPLRDLADAVHALCAVHGRHPGMIDEAHDHCAQPEACGWLLDAGRGFAAERGALVQLTAATGPLPSTPGQAETEAALVTMRHAVSMLARSDRGGCATGAAVALVGDWVTIRQVLESTARTVGVVLPRGVLPPARVTSDALAALLPTPATERAMLFGARQILAQHRGLWDILEARAAARDRS